MVPALAWIAWRTAEPTRRDRLRAVAGSRLRLAGLRAYCAYVYQLTGNPFEWAATLQRWGYHPGGAPWIAPLHLVGRLVTHPYLYLTTDPMAPYDTLYGVTGILFVAGGSVRVAAIRRSLRIVHAVEPVAAASRPACSRGWAGTARCCFPASSGWRRSVHAHCPRPSLLALRCSTRSALRCSRPSVRFSTSVSKRRMPEGGIRRSSQRIMSHRDTETQSNCSSVYKESLCLCCSLRLRLSPVRPWPARGDEAGNRPTHEVRRGSPRPTRWCEPAASTVSSRRTKSTTRFARSPPLLRPPSSGAVRSAALLAIRERELGTEDSGYLKRARDADCRRRTFANKRS